MIKMPLRNITQWLFWTAMILAPLSAQAQFGDLLKGLQKLAPPGQKPGGLPGMGGGTTKAKGGGLIPSEQWCKEQVGALGGMKIETGVIASEFKIKELEALSDDFTKA